MKNYVYVISGDHGRQKIGVSDNPNRRISELQTGSPFPLKFEFVGEAEDGSGYQIEVQAKFNLQPHKAAGGDEWYEVPSDVAITAVMAAAHRLGYRLRPVDANALPAPMGTATWEKAIKVAVFVAAIYPGILLLVAFDSGRLEGGGLSLALGTAAIIGGIKFAQYALIRTGRAMLHVSDSASSLIDQVKAPSSADRR